MPVPDIYLNLYNKYLQHKDSNTAIGNAIRNINRFPFSGITEDNPIGLDAISVYGKRLNQQNKGSLSDNKNVFNTLYEKPDATYVYKLPYQEPKKYDISRDAAIGRADHVYSNYSDAKDSPLSGTQETIYNALRYLKDNVWEGIPSGISNCTLTATQWVDPRNPIKNASSIVNNPLQYGYTAINSDDAVPGDLLIARVPNKDIYHTMLITGYTDNDGTYNFGENEYKYKKGEPLLTYSSGGHDNSFLRKDIPLSVYTANSNGHTENLFYRYNYPFEQFLPAINVIPSENP